MSGVDRGEVRAELFVVLAEEPQDALLGREVGLLGVFGVQVGVLRVELLGHEVGQLAVFVGPAVTAPSELVDLAATGLWVYADQAVIVW